MCQNLTLLLVTYPYTLILSAPTTVTSNLTINTHHNLLVGNNDTLRAVNRIGAITFSGANALARNGPHIASIISVARRCSDIRNRSSRSRNSRNGSGMLTLFTDIRANSDRPLTRTVIDRTGTTGIIVPITSGTSTATNGTMRTAVTKHTLTVNSPICTTSRTSVSTRRRTRVRTLRGRNGAISILFSRRDQRILKLITLESRLQSSTRRNITRLGTVNIHSIVLANSGHLATRTLTDGLSIR